MLESFGCGLYRSAAYSQVFTVVAFKVLQEWYGMLLYLHEYSSYYIDFLTCDPNASEVYKMNTFFENSVF